MPDTGHTHVRDLKPYRDVDAALKAIGEIYAEIAAMRTRPLREIPLRRP